MNPAHRTSLAQTHIVHQHYTHLYLKVCGSLNNLHEIQVFSPLDSAVSYSLLSSGAGSSDEQRVRSGSRYSWKVARVAMKLFMSGAATLP